MVDIERKAIDPVYREILKIQKRTTDGVDFQQEINAELRLQRLEDGITFELYEEFVYSILNETLKKLGSGYFIDAYNLISGINPNQYLTAELLLKYKLNIANYIVYLGEYPEYTDASINQATGEITI